MDLFYTIIIPLLKSKQYIKSSQFKYGFSYVLWTAPGLNWLPLPCHGNALPNELAAHVNYKPTIFDTTKIKAIPKIVETVVQTFGCP